MKAMGYDVTDFIECENCGKQATETAHIKARGMGGSKTKDAIENLMAKCRECHIALGDRKELMPYVIRKHFAVLDKKGIPYNKRYFEQFGIFI